MDLIYALENYFKKIYLKKLKKCKKKFNRTIESPNN